MPHIKDTEKQSQSDKFKDFARELDCDKDTRLLSYRIDTVAKTKLDKEVRN
tara:strand:- start:250 stop:402 length:153 start_codon:yes stop_codon:yes gene_type:complete